MTKPMIDAARSVEEEFAKIGKTVHEQRIQEQIKILIAMRIPPSSARKLAELLVEVQDDNLTRNRHWGEPKLSVDPASGGGYTAMIGWVDEANNLEIKPFHWTKPKPPVSKKKRSVPNKQHGPKSGNKFGRGGKPQF